MPQNGSPEHGNGPLRDDRSQPGDHTRQGDIGEVPGGASMPEAGGPQQAQQTGRLTRKIKLLNKFVDQTIKGLDSQTALLWVVLFRHERDGAVRISSKRLAKIMNVHPRTVSRHLKVLKQNGMLRKLRSGVQGIHGNVYQIGQRELSKDNPLKKESKNTSESQPEGHSGGQPEEETRHRSPGDLI